LRPGEDGDIEFLLDAAVAVVTKEVFDLIFPVVDAGISDVLIELLLQLSVLLHSFNGSLRIWYEVQVLHLVKGAVNSDYEALCPDGQTTVLGVREWHWRGSFVAGSLLESLLYFLNLVSEELVDHFSCFLVDVVLNKRALGKRVEVLEHLNSVLDR